MFSWSSFSLVASPCQIPISIAFPACSPENPIFIVAKIRHPNKRSAFLLANLAHRFLIGFCPQELRFRAPVRETQIPQTRKYSKITKNYPKGPPPKLPGKNKNKKKDFEEFLVFLSFFQVILGVGFWVIFSNFCQNDEMSTECEHDQNHQNRRK